MFERIGVVVWRVMSAPVLLVLLFPERDAQADDEIHWTITGQTSVSFAWRGAADSIRFGLTAAYDRAVQATAPVPYPFSSPGPFWEARLTGLAENTVYHYSIGGGPDHTFQTPPPRGSSGFACYAFGDIGSSIGYSTVVPVQALVAQGSPDFVLAVGDLTYGNAHGQAAVDQHFNDVMAWSQDAAYMPAWGNHEWDIPANDDLRNYKGRFDFVNSQTSPGSPAISCCGEDWYWFDYGNARFIAYPEPWSGAWQDWFSRASTLMDAAQADPAISYIVTFGHRPAYSSGNYSPGNTTLRGYLDSLGVRHGKYLLNLAGHDHNYQRSHPQHGVVHVTAGTGGSGLYPFTSNPTWVATRALHRGALRLDFTHAGIEGRMMCGPSGSGDNITCTFGSVIDSFVIANPIADRAPVVTAPALVSASPGTEIVIQVTASDPDGDPITSLVAGLTNLPRPEEASFIVSGANDSGTLRWTPQAADNGATYPVTFTATNALVGTATTQLQIGTPPPNPTILERRIVAGADDVEEKSTGAIDLASSDLEMMMDGATQHGVGLRFTALAIPPGVSITRAYLEFKADELQSETTTLTILGQAVDHAPAFTTTAGSLSARMTTEATVARVTWGNIAAWTTIGALHQTPELRDVIQEIVARPGWRSGNALVLLINGTGHRTAEAYEGDAAGAALLHLEFTAAPVNLAPVVNAGPDQTITLPSDVALDATVSDDGLPGPTFTVQWSQRGGAGTATFQDALAVDTRVSFSAPGTYPLELRADDGARSAADTTAITVMGPLNQAPVVNAGPDQSIVMPSDVILDATVSDDALPGPLTVQWSQRSGPGTATFLDALAVDTRASFSATGTYLLELRADDGALSSADTTAITVTPPVAPTIVERRIVAGADDVEERSTGAIDLASSDLEMMMDGATQHGVGLRFTALAIPPGASITRAYLQLKADELQSGTTTLTILGQAVDHAPAFTTTAGSLTARMNAATAASVTWEDIAPWTTVGAIHQTPELRDVIQEVVARPGWQSGNALVLLINGTGHRTAEAYEGDAAGAALLHLEFTAGAVDVPDVSPVGTLPPDVALAAWVVPNPLHRRGTLTYLTREAGPARAELFDLNGRRVRLLLDDAAVVAGRHSIDIVDRDDSGTRLAAGMYFYRVRVAAAAVSGRLLIVD